MALVEHDLADAGTGGRVPELVAGPDHEVLLSGADPVGLAARHVDDVAGREGEAGRRFLAAGDVQGELLVVVVEVGEAVDVGLATHRHQRRPLVLDRRRNGRLSGRRRLCRCRWLCRRCRLGGGLARLRHHDQRVAGVDPGGVPDVGGGLPELRPQVRVAVELLGEVPERVAGLDRVDLDVGRELGRGLVRRPVVPHLVEGARWRVDHLARSGPGEPESDDDSDGRTAHGRTPFP